MQSAGAVVGNNVTPLNSQDEVLNLFLKFFNICSCKGVHAKLVH